MSLSPLAPLAVTLACSIASCSPPTSPTSARTATHEDDGAIAAAGQAYLDLLVDLSPETATSLGLHARDTALDDRSSGAYASAIRREEVMLAELDRRFVQPSASASARTDLALIRGALAVDIRVRREVRPHRTQPSLYASPMNAIFLMMARDYAPAAERATKALLRIDQVPALLARARQELEAPPRVWTEVGIRSAQGAGLFFDEQRPLLLAALPGERPHIDASLAAAKKAYADYARFLETELLPRSTGQFAAGKDLFAFLLHNDAFLQEDAEALEARGRRVLETTKQQLAAVAREIDPALADSKGWPAVLDVVKGHHPGANALVESYRHEVERARAFLVAKDVVPFPPGDDCVVMETPPFLRSTIGSAAYDQPPPFDAVTKGFFFVTPVDTSLPAAKQEEMLLENNHGDQVDTSVHEAYPGHHLQLSFARRHPSVVRKASNSALFAEGWALYAEELMHELGYYTPEERMMQLVWTLVRAARVVIDVGLHTKGMTFDAAVQMLTDEVHLERELAVTEVRRYSLTPTQPLSYLIGREMILALREKWRAHERAAFALKRFHGELLSHGTIPVGLIEREMLSL